MKTILVLLLCAAVFQAAVCDNAGLASGQRHSITQASEGSRATSYDNSDDNSYNYASGRSKIQSQK